MNSLSRRFRIKRDPIKMNIRNHILLRAHLSQYIYSPILSTFLRKCSLISFECCKVHWVFEMLLSYFPSSSVKRPGSVLFQITHTHTPLHFHDKIRWGIKKYHCIPATAYACYKVSIFFKYRCSISCYIWLQIPLTESSLELRELETGNL